MKASEYASLEENSGKHLLDVMDGFANLKCIAFEKWKSENAKALCDVWVYEGRHYTFEQLLKIYNEKISDKG